MSKQNIRVILQKSYVLDNHWLVKASMIVTRSLTKIGQRIRNNTACQSTAIVRDFLSDFYCKL